MRGLGATANDIATLRVSRLSGMEGIKMFTADDLMKGNFAGAGGEDLGDRWKKSRRPVSEWRQELVEFYETYGLQDKLAGVDAALEKWKGREGHMMKAVQKKYEKEVLEYWDKIEKKPKREPKIKKQYEPEKMEL